MFAKRKNTFLLLLFAPYVQLYINLFTLCIFKYRAFTPKSVAVLIKITRLMRVVKGIFVTRDLPFFFPVKCEMPIFFLVIRDFHSSREA